MTAYQLHVALNKLSDLAYDDYDYSLTKGKMGRLLVSMLAYSFVSLKHSYRAESISLFNDMVSHIHNLSNGFLTGNLGAIWGIGYLSQEGLIERPPFLTPIGLDIIEKNSKYFRHSPIRYNQNQPIYPFGLTLLALLPNNDSLEQYSIIEQIIFRLRDCEAILTSNIKGLHSPTNLSASQMHSIAAFVSIAHRAMIYPHLTGHLISTIDQLFKESCHPMNTDGYILGTILNNTPVFNELIRPHDLISILSYVGVLSLIYNKPNLFLSFCNKICSIEDVLSLFTSSNSTSLTGVALGLLNIYING